MQIAVSTDPTRLNQTRTRVTGTFDPHRERDGQVIGATLPRTAKDGLRV